MGFCSINVVVKNASGKYIIWVDCDMILPKDHVQKQVEFMEQNPKVGIAYRVKAEGWQIKRTNAYFYERRVKSWRDLWRKYFWYGYGNYHLYRKNRGILSPTRMNPIAGF
ncbi:MAG: glycosyltransferase [Candidatus Aenigmatarchaeota archaeon]